MISTYFDGCLRILTTDILSDNTGCSYLNIRCPINLLDTQCQKHGQMNDSYENLQNDRTEWLLHFTIDINCMKSYRSLLINTCSECDTFIDVNKFQWKYNFYLFSFENTSSLFFGHFVVVAIHRCQGNRFSWLLRRHTLKLYWVWLKKICKVYPRH